MSAEMKELEQKKLARKALVAVAVGAAALVGLGGLTLVHRALGEKALARETDAAATPTVLVATPAPAAGEAEIALPATLEAWQDSPIYARQSGYVKRWTKDIGSRVRAGEVLATIDAPELDQELAQAQAQQRQIEAQLKLQEVTAARWTNLRKSDSVSQQESDQQNSALAQGRAALSAAVANVRRLQQMESFKTVRAPYAGVLTKRNAEVGQLINAGAANGAELFDIAQDGKLRVRVALPQSYMEQIKTGAKAYVTLQERPGEKFAGVVARNAQAVDATTRTLLTEIEIDNAGGKLLPGSYVQAHFALDHKTPRLTAPVSAMIFRKEGPRVAVVDANGVAHMRQIVIGRDLGASLEVLSGLNAGDKVIVNPPDSIEEGESVHVANGGGKQ